MYKFFQTKKNFRKNINKIKIRFNYDLLKNKFLVEKIEIDEKYNDKIQKYIDIINSDKIKFDHKNFYRKHFNGLIESL